jgi:hypothetical protein
VSLLQPEQRTLVDESGMIKTKMGNTIDQKMVAVAWIPLYDTTPYFFHHGSPYFILLGG